MMRPRRRQRRERVLPRVVADQIADDLRARLQERLRERLLAAAPGFAHINPPDAVRAEMKRITDETIAECYAEVQSRLQHWTARREVWEKRLSRAVPMALPRRSS